MSFEYLIDPERARGGRACCPASQCPTCCAVARVSTPCSSPTCSPCCCHGNETNGQFGIITSESPAGDIIPTHSHNETHETFYVLEGKVRLFFQDAEGTKTSKLLNAGDFGYVPAGFPHAYRIEEAARMMGVLSGGFERFFQHMGTPTDHATKDQPPFIPDLPRMQAAAQQHNMQFMPDYQWPDA